MRHASNMGDSIRYIFVSTISALTGFALCYLMFLQEDPSAFTQRIIDSVDGEIVSWHENEKFSAVFEWSDPHVSMSFAYNNDYGHPVLFFDGSAESISIRGRDDKKMVVPINSKTGNIEMISVYLSDKGVDVAYVDRGLTGRYSEKFLFDGERPSHFDATERDWVKRENRQ